jgi:aldose sugar dehydrogenase
VHFGTRFVFDKGYIYFVIGERGGMMEAQDLSRPNGKIFRLHDDGRVPRTIRSSKQGRLAGIWSYGHRNPQGLAMDPRDGALYSTEHGPRGGDELNLILPGLQLRLAGDHHGMNYNGTPMVTEGSPRRKAWSSRWSTGRHPSPACGLDFVTGDKFPKWKTTCSPARSPSRKCAAIRIADWQGGLAGNHPQEHRPRARCRHRPGWIDLCAAQRPRPPAR